MPDSNQFRKSNFENQSTGSKVTTFVENLKINFFPIFPAKFVTFEPVHTGPEWRLFVQKLFLLQKDINYTWIGLIIIKIGEKIVNSDFRGCMTIFQKIHFHNFSTSNFEYWKKCSYLDTFQSFLDLLMIFQILSRHSYSWETWKKSFLSNDIKIIEDENNILNIFYPRFSGKKISLGSKFGTLGKI